MKIFYPETLAETVRETKTESEESDTKLRHYLLKKKPTLMLKRRQTMKNLQRMNQHSLDEEGREEDKEKEEPIAAGMDEGGGEGKLVKSEEPYERLHCKKCNFVTSAKSKKVRIDGLRRHVKSHHAGKSITIAEDQTALEDVNPVLDDEEKDVSAENETKEGGTRMPHISHYRR